MPRPASRVPDEKALYRLLWMSWLAVWGEHRQHEWRKQLLQDFMDEIGPRIAQGDRLRWESFIRTLPGFVETMGG